MKRALIGCQVVLLTMTVAASVQAQPYSIGGKNYYPAGSTEIMNAAFNPVDGGVSTGSYSGFVRLVVSGSGVSCTPATNDAFYIYVWLPGCGNPNVVPQHDGWYYQLTFGTQTLVPLDVSRIATNFIYYDITTGAEVLARPYTPVYRTDHTYSFIVNTGLASPGRLHFGVSDGGFGDNSGAYQVQITQLSEGFPLTVTGGSSTGSGGVTSQAGLTPAINCTVTAGVASGVCSQLYAPGTVVTLTAAQATGSSFTQWDGASCGGNASCTVTVSQALNMAPRFILLTYPLTVSGLGTGSGTVTSQAGLSPPINCTITAGTATGACSQMYPHGTAVTLTATATASMFTGWGVCTGLGTCTVEMLQARAVIPTFVVQPTVAGVTPNVGLTSGNTPVSISGSGFVPGATSVAFGGVPATGVAATSTSALTAVTPAGTVGPTSVTVTTAGGTGALAGGFTYVAAPEVASLTPSVSSPFVPDVNVTFTATATGGLAPLQYKFYLQDSQTSTWSVLQDYSTSNQVTWTPHALGNYALQVWVRSAGSTAGWDGWKAYGPFEVRVPPLTIASFTTPTVFPVPPNTSTTWTATASGGVAPLQYRFWLYDHSAATWTMLSDYSPADQVTWTPQRVGTYSLQVWVRSAGSAAKWEVWQGSGPIEVKLPPVTIESVTTPTAFPVPPNTSITWTVTASGGQPPLEYQFWLYHAQAATWEVLRAYAPDATAAWTPTEAGTYRLQVWVRSAGSTASYDAWRATDQEAVIEDARPRVTSLTAQPPSPVNVSTPVTWTATATGGTPPLQYRFYLYNVESASWTMLQDYSTSNQVTWTPAAAGTHSTQVWVRNAGSTAKWDDWKASGTFSVVSGLTVETFTSNVSPPVTVGTPVTLTATTAGGIAPVEYRFWVHDPSGAWIVLRDYGPGGEVIWTPTTAGTYSMQVWVRSAGSSAKWEAWKGLGPFDVGAALPTVTALTAAPLPLTRGVPMTWTATATGGVAPLQYRFWLYSAATGTWTVLQDYSTSNTAAWTPPAAGAYGVEVWVRGTGSTARYEAFRTSGLLSVQ